MEYHLTGGKDLSQDFETFFKSNERRIHYQIHRLGISDDWYEDFYSEGILALWRAYEEYDEVKGDIGTFINFRIRYRLLDLLRKKIREQEKKRKSFMKNKCAKSMEM